MSVPSAPPAENACTHHHHHPFTICMSLQQGKTRSLVRSRGCHPRKKSLACRRLVSNGPEPCGWAVLAVQRVTVQICNACTLARSGRGSSRYSIEQGITLPAGPAGKGYGSNQAWKMEGDSGLSDSESGPWVLHRWSGPGSA